MTYLDTNSIDALFDQADMEQAQRTRLLQYRYNPRYASDTDFTNPYIVVVHENQIPAEINAGNLAPEVGAKVLQQISEIKARHPRSWSTGSPFTVSSEIPKDRPIVVCGAFEEICVREQYIKLLTAGHDAYISTEGTLSFESLN